MAEKLTRDQIDAAFALIGMQPRECDYKVIDLTGGTVKDAAAYIWDHMLGEPRAPSRRKIEKAITMVLAGLATKEAG